MGNGHDQRLSESITWLIKGHLVQSHDNILISAHRIEQSDQFVNLHSWCCLNRCAFPAECVPLG